MFKKILNAVKRSYYHIICLFLFLNRYDRKFFYGKFFQKFWDIGWEWAYFDHKNCKRLNVNISARFPVSARTTVICPENIKFNVDDINNFQSYGQYYQAISTITIGKGTYIAPNVGIITANHDFANLDEHQEGKPVIIGEECWIGMNSVILPGVNLGKKTIVGAGSVVTKSFPEGNQIIAGNPARVIRELD